jgi:dTDP-4-amino-4,6-dideoxygalactose transaminase
MNDRNKPVIPFVDLGKQFESIEPEIMEAVRAVVKSSAFIRGAPLTEFEQAFAELHGVPHAIGVGSGTDALNLSVQALGLKPGDEVITVPNSWISTAFAISHTGATPVFVDVDPDTYQMDAAKLAEAITDRTKAIIPVHLFGHPAPMAEIEELCRGKNIQIIEDVAQAPLARINGNTVGTIGALGCFSFYPSKNLGAYGDGGLILTSDDQLAETIRQLANYGQSETYKHVSVGINSRLDTLQAAILLCKLPNLKAWTESRRTAAKHYDKLLAPLPIKRAATAEGAEPVYHLYVVEVDDRDKCLSWLRENGVMAQVHYPSVIHLQECYQHLGYTKGDFPAAENAADKMISLPIYPEITPEQIRYVVDTLKGFLDSSIT